MRLIPIRYHSTRKSCITVGCYELTHARGLCKKCYDEAIYLVREGIESWESLENSSKARPNKKRK